jgi:ADP-heptose:LPS heptosyltransferase
MAEMLGAEKTPDSVWAVAKQTTAEIDYLVRGIGKKSKSKPVGIDAFYFYRAFGARQASGVIKALLPVVKNAVYLYADETPDASEMEWLSRFNLPLMHHLTVAQLGALLGHSELVITGNTLLFGLATLLGTKAVGVFDKNGIDVYCPKIAAARGVVFDKTINNETVSGIINAVVELER